MSSVVITAVAVVVVVVVVVVVLVVVVVRVVVGAVAVLAIVVTAVWSFILRKNLFQNVDFVYVKTVGHNLKYSHRSEVGNC
jgi:c-di-AMP phosphodiesterase-like protein